MLKTTPSATLRHGCVQHPVVKNEVDDLANSNNYLNNYAHQITVTGKVGTHRDACYRERDSPLIANTIWEIEDQTLFLGITLENSDEECFTTTILKLHISCSWLVSMDSRHPLLFQPYA